eukprot:TRINITY_DN16802_c0_g2_i2.p1 TRINITY_DN16802_c0_g2~~TRINITY_DN16802_c0_g2_i2.p1  ORF type:complete len:102 (-),score=21.58 TRINITY_DN16802_c0_g2_i2:43-348(-)
MAMAVTLARLLGQEVALFAKSRIPALISQSPEFATGNYSQALVNAFLKIDELLRSSEGKKELKEMGAQLAKTSERKDGMNVGSTACAVSYTHLTLPTNREV